jgi:hypothetical protein
MKNFLNRIFNRGKLTPEQQALVSLSDAMRVLESHLIAVARLQFIKPETLVRESNNVEGNSSYIDELMKARGNESK